MGVPEPITSIGRSTISQLGRARLLATRSRAHPHVFNVNLHHRPVILLCSFREFLRGVAKLNCGLSSLLALIGLALGHEIKSAMGRRIDA
jgi:hypothetical protein